MTKGGIGMGRTCGFPRNGQPFSAPCVPSLHVMLKNCRGGELSESHVDPVRVRSKTCSHIPPSLKHPDELRLGVKIGLTEQVRTRQKGDPKTIHGGGNRIDMRVRVVLVIGS